MKYVSASEAKQRFAAVLDAAQREPVTIRRQNREVAVVVSSQDYRRLKSANIAEFQRFCERVAIQASERGMTEERFNDLLGD